jgi:hypothetical protein
MSVSIRMIAVGLHDLVWRKGEERCERSYKPAEQQAQAQQAQAQQAQAQPQHIQPDGFRKVSTKREEACAKINERYLVGQPTQNPFMPNNNYANDIENQMNFLTPQKS